MIDWRQVLLQLRGTDLSYGQISLSTNVPCGTLRAMAHRGGQPVYTNGESIVVYWCKRMNMTRDQLPKVVATETGICTSDGNTCVDASNLHACEPPLPIS